MGLRDFTVIFAIFILSTTACYAFEDYNSPTHNLQVQQDFSGYMDNVRTKLQKNWIPPDFLEEGHTRVTFKLDRSGKILTGNIIESSGNDVYDSSAINAIAKSEPFGDFPENSTRQTITINYSFDTSLVKTDRMKEYYEKAKRYQYSDRNEALKYINLAIAEVNGDENSYFLYKRKAKIEEAMGDHVSAKADMDTYNKLKSRIDIKRVHFLKHQAEVEDNAFSYYYLAYAYEQLGDYESAIKAIDKAIERTDLNNQYKRYRAELISKKNS